MSIYIALCTPLLKPGAVKFNTEKIVDCIIKAKKADIIVFPRLSITGATCMDMFSYPLLTSAALDALKDICTDKTVVVGLPVVKNGEVYDGTAIIKDGSYTIYTMPQGITDTGSNIKYGNDIIPPFTTDGMTVSVCPDLSPLQSDLILVPAAYPSYVGTFDEIYNKARSLPAAAIVSSGIGESVSGRIMSGDKTVCVSGKLESYGGYDEEIVFSKIGKTKSSNIMSLPKREISFTPLSDNECALIYEIMGRGIFGRMNEIGTDKVIIGLSGGLDSANVLVAAALAFEKRKLDKKNIICVTMRGESSSHRTQNNAAALIDAFKVTGINVPIDSAVALHMRAISHLQKDVVYENAQARERTQILLDLSNKYNALMLGTGDMSEICLGWSTFGGDQLSQYNPNCSLTKTAIRKLLAYYTGLKSNKVAAKIIDDILATPVSPELLADQNTEEILGPYEVQDYFIEEMIAKKRSSKQALSGAIEKFGLSEPTAKKYIATLISRMFKYQFKRNFGPDGVKLFPYDITGMQIRSDFSPELWLSDIE